LAHVHARAPFLALIDCASALFALSFGGYESLSYKFRWHLALILS